MPLPITKVQAIKCITWMKENFSKEMKKATDGTPFSIDTLCGIACQETAYVWMSWIGKKTAAEILGLCVFDASGDYPGTKRSAFPKNTAAFKAAYGAELTDMLISEANRSRKQRGLGAAQWVYKGYGIYQYDLQHIVTDKSFFTAKKWYSYDECLKKVMSELTLKWSKYKDMYKTIKAYNGSGPAAENYANNVTIFISYSKEVVLPG
jgi:hypothetical protein